MVANSWEGSGAQKTKVRDHKFQRPRAAFKILYLEGEPQEVRRTERKLKGFAKTRQALEKMLSSEVCSPDTNAYT